MFQNLTPVTVEKLRLVVKSLQIRRFYLAEPRSYGTGFRFCGCKGNTFINLYGNYFYMD